MANAAEDMDDPRRLLPKALYMSVIIVILIYVAVSVAVVGNLDIHSILRAKDYALAEAAKPFLGNFGFRLIAVGVLFSTASAINATLFGAANVSYVIARDGQLPQVFSWRFRQNATGGLFITVRSCDRIHSVFRSLRDSDDGKRRFSLDLCMRACRPSESSSRDRRQQVDSESVLSYLLGHAGGPNGLYLPELPVRVDHDDRVDSDLFVRGIGLPASNRTNYQH